MPDGLTLAPLPYRFAAPDGVTVEILHVPTLIDAGAAGLARLEDASDHDAFYARPVSRRLRVLVRQALEAKPAPGSTVSLEYSPEEGEPARLGPNSVSLAIAEAIRASGLTQAEVARRMGVSRPLVTRWVNPRYHRHEVETLRRLAEVLGLELSVRFGPPQCAA